jgi:hypothetical protein
MVAVDTVISTGDYVHKRSGVESGFLGSLQHITPTAVGVVLAVLPDNGDVAVLFNEATETIIVKPIDLCRMHDPHGSAHHEVHFLDQEGSWLRIILCFDVAFSQ